MCVVRLPWLRPEPTWPPPLWTSSHPSLRWWHRSHWWRQSDLRWDTLSRWDYLFKNTQNTVNLVSVITDKKTNSLHFYIFKKSLFHAVYARLRFRKAYWMINWKMNIHSSKKINCVKRNHFFPPLQLWNVYGKSQSFCLLLNLEKQRPNHQGRHVVSTGAAVLSYKHDNSIVVVVVVFLLCVYWLLAKQR